MTTHASTTKCNPAPAAATIDPILSSVLGSDAAQLPPELAARVAEALRTSATPAANAPLADERIRSDVPPPLSSAAIWSPIPNDKEIGREEAFYRRTDHRLPA